ncbi:MAG: tRNA (adenosine(37)-N6)-threonylcarbamoyltransferase complex dimerization subunit type 1 TsaB [Planctomycetota bacterium]
MSDDRDPLPAEGVFLGIETSFRPGSVAVSVLRDGRLVHHGREEVEQADRRQAAAVVSVAAGLCGAGGVRLADVTAVGVSLGPGSFTGLRVGMTFAKTLAHQNRVPLFGFPTMRVAADWFLVSDEDGESCRVLIDAQAGHVFRQDWGKRDDGVCPLGDLERITRDAAYADGPEDRIVKIPHHDDELGAVPHAGMITTLTMFAVGRGDSADLLDPVTAEPLYVRRSGAEEKADAATKSRPEA